MILFPMHPHQAERIEPVDEPDWSDAQRRFLIGLRNAVAIEIAAVIVILLPIALYAYWTRP